jgi:prepilin-type N-terminal cleavage/methylation domain-containing protein
MRRRTQRGVTLIELLIAVTLVAAISAGMLSALRMGLDTMGRTQQRLEDNRRAMSRLDVIRRHIGGAMPANGLCQAQPEPVQNALFRGGPYALLLATSESLTEGSRGYPRIAVYRVLPNPDGTVRLTVEEHWFSGPASTIPFCALTGEILPPQPSAVDSTAVLFERLGEAHFEYRAMSFLNRTGMLWETGWNNALMPGAVRLVLQPVPGEVPRMPLGTINIPFHISREQGAVYGSAPQ